MRFGGQLFRLGQRRVCHSGAGYGSPNVHVVLVDPVIPGNTGAIGRTCLGLGASLHLVNPGFRVDDTSAKRAGLDYWHHVDLTVHQNWETFHTQPWLSGCQMQFVTKFGTENLYHHSFPVDANDLVLVFGSETRGFRDIEHLFDLEEETKVMIPMRDVPNSVRSFNLASSVAMVLFEAKRQILNNSNN